MPVFLEVFQTPRILTEHGASRIVISYIQDRGGVCCGKTVTVCRVGSLSVGIPSEAGRFGDQQK
jgi:hypothetical protein